MCVHVCIMALGTGQGAIPLILFHTPNLKNLKTTTYKSVYSN